MEELQEKTLISSFGDSWWLLYTQPIANARRKHAWQIWRRWQPWMLLRKSQGVKWASDEDTVLKFHFIGQIMNDTIPGVIP